MVTLAQQGDLERYDIIINIMTVYPGTYLEDDL